MVFVPDTFVVKDWKNTAAGGTPINELSLEELEGRLAAYSMALVMAAADYGDANLAAGLAALQAGIPSDAASGTPSLRSLGVSGTQAAPGNDARLSDARTALPHTHPQSDVTGLAGALAGKAAAVHTHATADVTGLDAALAAKADSSALAAKADAAALTAEIAGRSLGEDRVTVGNRMRRVVKSTTPMLENSNAFPMVARHQDYNRERCVIKNMGTTDLQVKFGTSMYSFNSPGFPGGTTVSPGKEWVSDGSSAPIYVAPFTNGQTVRFTVYVELAVR